MVGARHRTGAIFRTGIRVFESLTILFLLNCLVAALLYVLGNYQDFLDSSQFLLLDVLRVSGALCTLAGLYYLVSLIVWSLRVRRFLIWRILFSMVAAIVGMGAIGATMFLSVLVS